ncbi:hypothetical protein TNCV_3366101 [Trichonephila clavipes]|nr:hypothetical protein TNCV_3366101 [Trichonephila clavipes]
MGYARETNCSPFALNKLHYRAEESSPRSLEPFELTTHSSSHSKHGYSKCHMCHSRATCPLVRLVEGKERWENSDQPEGILPQNWGGNEPNHTVICMVLKATANDRGTASPLP